MSLPPKTLQSGSTRTAGWRSLCRPQFPFNPANSPIFYGWVITVVTVIGVLMSIPGQTAGVSVFTDHLLQANQISRLQLSNTYLVGTLTSGLLLPMGGRWLDFWGARAMVVISSLWLACTLVVLSQSDRIIAVLSTILPVIPPTELTLILLGLGFTNLRFSGQGMLTMVSRNTVGKWFDRRRGKVSGLSGIFISFGFASAPLFFSTLIQWLDWRSAWLVLAALVGIGMTTIGWLFYRDNPEVCGLVMDGDSQLTDSSSPVQEKSSEPFTATHPERIQTEPLSQSLDSTQAADSRVTSPAESLSNSPSEIQPSEPPFMSTLVGGATRQEALKTLKFWATTLALSSQSLVITGITFHIVDIGAGVGLSEPQTVALFLPMAFISTTIGYLIGWLSDRTPVKRLFLFMMTVQFLGIVGMANLGLPIMRVMGIVGFGCSGGCFGTLSTIVLPRFFGRAHLGAIAGVQMMSLVIASALGPSLLAFMERSFQSYQPGLYLCCSFPVLAFCLLLTMRSPRRPIA